MLTMHKIPNKADPLVFIKNRLLNMNSPRTVAIVPTNRNLRKLVSSAKWELDIQTVAEFTRRANLYANTLLPKELRKYYFYKAAKSLPKTEQSKMLHSNEPDLLKGYINFISTSSDLLPFYREFNAEGLSAQALKADFMYSDYEEQIAVLINLWQIYCGIINKAGFVDEWECYSSPLLDEKYLSRYDNYLFLIGGYLNNYEITQLKSIADKHHVELYFNYTEEIHYQKDKLEKAFDSKITEDECDPPVKLRAITTNDDIELCKKNSEIAILYQKQEEFILAIKPSSAHLTAVEIRPCDNALSQFDLITKRICELHFNDGIPFANMAVILPTAEFAQLFLNSDPYNIFNVSAGKPVSSYRFHETLCMLCEFIAGINEEKVTLELLEQFLASSCFQNYGTELFYKSISELRSSGKMYIGLESIINFKWNGAKLLHTMVKPFTKPYLGYSDCIKAVSAVLEAVLPEFSEEEAEGIIHSIDELGEMLFLYDCIEEKFLPAELLSTVLNELATLSIPLRKGDVSVLGLLESRNMQHDYIFIPGMNSEQFPIRHGKDLFLNSELRYKLQLPTTAAREALQKGYCRQIIARAKHTVLTYSTMDGDQPSSFIQELLTSARVYKEERSDQPYDPKNYMIFPSISRKRKIEEYSEIIKDSRVMERIKSFEFSATSLACFRDCPLHFFYRFIKRIKTPVETVDNTDPRIVGSILHSVMETLFREGVLPTDSAYPERMKAIFDEKISVYDYFTTNPIGIFHSNAIKNSFSELIKHERERVENGAVVQGFEERIDCNMFGFRFGGRIDRWDRTDSGYDIIDYKYKNLEEQKPQKERSDDAETDSYFEKTELQLPLYAVMMEKKFKYRPEKMLWFDLKGKQGFINGFYKESIDGFTVYLEKLMANIAKPDVPFRNAKESIICERCDYSSFCCWSLQ